MIDVMWCEGWLVIYAVGGVWIPVSDGWHFGVEDLDIGCDLSAVLTRKIECGY